MRLIQCYIMLDARKYQYTILDITLCNVYFNIRNNGINFYRVNKRITDFFFILFYLIL